MRFSQAGPYIPSILYLHCIRRMESQNVDEKCFKLYYKYILIIFSILKIITVKVHLLQPEKVNRASRFDSMRQ